MAEIQTDMGTPIGSIGSTDPNPPDVHLEQPADGALVSDIVVIEAHATDDVGVFGVQFFVDGVPTGLLDEVAPYALTWDTRTAGNGAHTLTAQAHDASANSAVSPPVTVNVSNTNFFRNEILATGFDLPTAIKFLPDGSMLVVELAGTVKVVPAPLHFLHTWSAEPRSPVPLYRRCQWKGRDFLSRCYPNTSGSRWTRGCRNSSARRHPGTAGITARNRFILSPLELHEIHVVSTRPGCR